jgi:hypothetical protein
LRLGFISSKSEGKDNFAFQFIGDQSEFVILEGLSDDYQSVLFKNMVVGRYHETCEFQNCQNESCENSFLYK